MKYIPFMHVVLHVPENYLQKKGHVTRSDLIDSLSDYHKIFAEISSSSHILRLHLRVCLIFTMIVFSKNHCPEYICYLYDYKFPGIICFDK